MQEPSSGAPNTLQAVERSFRIVERLRELEGAGVTELADDLGLHKSTVHAHLRTLSDCGYVVNNDGAYNASLKLLKEGARIRENMQTFKISRSEVQNLANETGELVNIGVLEDGRVNIIFMVEGENAVHDHEPIGKYSYVHCTAIGKAMISKLSAEEVDDILDCWGMPQFTENTITDRERLHNDLSEIRDRGYAIDREEGNLGIRCIGAAITDQENAPIGGVSITGPTNRLAATKYEENLSTEILNAVNVIEVNMQYS